MEIDQDIAQQLFIYGATFVFLDVPKGTEFGIDCNSWQVDEKFKGVKMIPPGIHFIFYSSTNNHGQHSPRTGFFVDFKREDVIVKRWNPQTENISPEEMSQDEIESIKENKKELDSFLAPYPYDGYKHWVSLSSQLTVNTVGRLQPSTGLITSVAQFQSEASNSQQRSQLKKDQTTSTSPKSELDGLPDMKLIEGTEINFTQIPKHKYPQGSCVSDITRHNIDSSYTLECVLQSYKSDTPHKNLLAELQFIFLCFLLGQSYDAFEHWKKLIRILCTCDSALVGHSDLFTELIGCLHYQIKEVPEDFFVDICEQDNFLFRNLQTFFSNIYTNNRVSQPLLSKAHMFKKHLQKKFKWDFTDEPGEYAPVVVET